MSGLTSATKRLSAAQYQASDGTVYLIQKVNTTQIILENGSLPDLMAARDGIEDDPSLTAEQRGQKAFEDLSKRSPEEASRMLGMSMQMPTETLKKGLVGWIDENGQTVIIRWTDKPAVLLEEGEVNANLVPTELRDELIEQINTLGGKPEVAPEVVSRFPGK